MIWSLSPPQLSYLLSGCPVLQPNGGYTVYFQAQGPAPRQTGSQSGGVVEGREVDACVRETLSHIPPAAGSRPGLRRGFVSFSRPLRFLRSSGSYSFPARKQPSPATAGRWGGYKGMGRRGEEAEQFGFKMSPGLSTASRGLKS